MRPFEMDEMDAKTDPMQRAGVVSRGAETASDEDLTPPEGTSAARTDEAGPEAFQKLQAAVREFEREYLLKALRASGGKKMKAAGLLGISRKSLWEKLRAYGVSSPRVVAGREVDRGRGTGEDLRSAGGLEP